MKTLATLLIPAALIAAVPVFAGEPVDSKTPNEAISIPEPTTPWSISAGATVRSVRASFHNVAPPALNGLAFIHTLSSDTDPGLFTGGTGTVFYSDGQVGPDYNLKYFPSNGPSGDALGIINRSSQVTPNTGTETSTGTPIATINFHDTQTVYSYSPKAMLHGYGAADSDVGVGPYVNLSYAVFSTPTDSISVMAGWSFVQTTPKSGAQALGVETVTQTQTTLNHTYSYNYDQGLGTAANPGTSFPFNGTSQATGGFIVYNPALYSGVPSGDGFLPPHEGTTSSATSKVLATFVPVASSNLRVNSNEVVFAATYEHAILPWLHVGVSVGPTLNVIDSSINTTVDWYMNGRSSPVASAGWHNDENAFKVGAMGQVNIQADITKSLFVELHGSYRWVNSESITNGPASATVNVSSWEGGLGLGLRF